MTTSQFNEYKTLASAYPDFATRVLILRALVGLHLTQPSNLRLVGAI